MKKSMSVLLAAAMCSAMLAVGSRMEHRRQKRFPDLTEYLGKVQIALYHRFPYRLDIRKQHLSKQTIFKANIASRQHRHSDCQTTAEFFVSNRHNHNRTHQIRQQEKSEVGKIR